MGVADLLERTRDWHVSRGPRSFAQDWVGVNGRTLSDEHLSGQHRGADLLASRLLLSDRLGKQTPEVGAAEKGRVMGSHTRQGHEADTTEAEPGRDRRRSPILPALIVSLGLVVAGYLVGGRGGQISTSGASATIPVEEPTVGHVIDLPPVNVNLADGRYLRVGVAMGVAHSDDEILDTGTEAAETEGSSAAEPTAPAADLVLETFAGKSFEELAVEPGRETARAALHEGLRTFYGDKVLQVFFTQFVMQ